MDSEDEMYNDEGEVMYDEDEEEMHDDDADLDIEIRSYNPHQKANEADEYHFEVLSAEEIVQHMINTIKEVNAVVTIPATTTRILLNHFKWDKEKLMERFFDGNQEDLFKEARIINPLLRKDTAIDTENPRPEDCRIRLEECGICFSTLLPSMLTGLDCEHRFCTSCWAEYLRTKIMEEGECQMIPCPAHKCSILVDDASVMNLVKDSKVKSKYQHLITNSFVACNKLLRWCPTPGCDNAIKVQHIARSPVTCKCGRTFCYQCGEAWHDPVDCELLRKWTKKCNDDSETTEWMNTNTKECPKCHVPIEKNGGCNWITCDNKNCRAYWCWLCFEVINPIYWKQHGCVLYSENETVTNESLERYLFFWERFTNHAKSLKIESELYASIEKKMEEMQLQSMSWIEVQYLKKAVDVLCSCRQTLMYTYVFAFFLKKSNLSAIFEDNQADLQAATECLSGYLERDISKENLLDIKRQVEDKYRYCVSRSKRLLEHVHEGYEKDLWEFRD